jgi:hypothetical protein
MLIGGHPEIRRWNPYRGVTFPAPFLTDEEMLRLPIKDIVCEFPSTINFALGTNEWQVLIPKTFRDGRFAAAIYRNKRKLVGLPFSVIGYIDIDYGEDIEVMPDHSAW